MLLLEMIDPELLVPLFVLVLVFLGVSKPEFSKLTRNSHFFLEKKSVPVEFLVYNLAVRQEQTSQCRQKRPPPK